MKAIRKWQRWQCFPFNPLSVTFCKEAMKITITMMMTMMTVLKMMTMLTMMTIQKMAMMMTMFLFQSSQSDLWWQESIVITRKQWRYRLRWRQWWQWWKWRQWWQWWWQCFSFNPPSLTFEADSAAALLSSLQSCKIIPIKDENDDDTLKQRWKWKWGQCSECSE